MKGCPLTVLLLGCGWDISSKADLTKTPLSMSYCGVLVAAGRAPAGETDAFVCESDPVYP